MDILYLKLNYFFILYEFKILTFYYHNALCREKQFKLFNQNLKSEFLINPDSEIGLIT